MIVREATAADWPEVLAFFLATPLQSGTSFVLDRRPDFGALPRLRGAFRTLLAYEQERLAGTVTALWRAGRDGPRHITVGEITDLRVAKWARGGRAMFQLVRAAYDVFVAAQVNWIVCLIGKHNQATVPLVARRVGITPTLAPLEDFASVHFVAGRVPRFLAAKGLMIREAVPTDAVLVAEFCTTEYASERFAPPEVVAWPDPAGRHRAWLAFEPDGTPCGALMIWDGDPVRRLRIIRYRAADLPLRVIVALGARLGLTAPLPVPGDVFGLWATRLISIRRGGANTLRALLEATLAAAAAAGRSAVQLNLHGRDPLLRDLPPYPRSTYWTTLYGGCRDATAVASDDRSERYHADLARI